MKHPEFLSGHKINELVWEGVVVAVVVVKGVRVWLSFGYVVIVLVEVIEVVMGGGYICTQTTHSTPPTPF